jgi:hypothetical protein
VDVISAAVLLRHADRFLLQRKDAGYPLQAFRDHLCFVGGSWTASRDRTPKDTALRELEEEVAPFPGGGLRFVGAFDLWIPELRTRTRDYHILNFIYTMELDTDGHKLLEGDAAWLDQASAQRGRWCWGYDHVMAQSAAELGLDWQGSVDAAVRCAPNPTHGDTPFAAMDLEGLRLNPLRDGDIDEAAPLR